MTNKRFEEISNMISSTQIQSTNNVTYTENELSEYLKNKNVTPKEIKEFVKLNIYRNKTINFLTRNRS